ncbi:hypothetical protein C4D60_Mb09t04520 [Musa balbisiana]|uniref:NAC domain-containing protein n=1 Tax=Musa balbisiana TaxID=52838 RepID=A0A4S8IDZ7_MUSBA|nr:hypothetical protein C4D60_Mb09t04520 [Musa balbisiana]
MGEVDLNRCEPWDLPIWRSESLSFPWGPAVVCAGKANMGEKEWYFFCRRDRKYPTGMRTNRATGAGFWTATGKDKEVFRGRGVLVGMKKTLVVLRRKGTQGREDKLDDARFCRKLLIYEPSGCLLHTSSSSPELFLLVIRELLESLGAERNDDSSAIRRHCKVEQHSNKSMGCPWQDTGLSADHNTEISSVVSKPYDDLDDPSSTAPFFDLEAMWSFRRIRARSMHQGHRFIISPCVFARFTYMVCISHCPSRQRV